MSVNTSKKKEKIFYHCLVQDVDDHFRTYLHTTSRESQVDFGLDSLKVYLERVMLWCVRAIPMCMCIYIYIMHVYTYIYERERERIETYTKYCVQHRS